MFPHDNDVSLVYYSSHDYHNEYFACHQQILFYLHRVIQYEDEYSNEALAQGNHSIYLGHPLV
ncbi:Uncharacterised protein [Serratia fonticola]|nr:Uncharacterised protein [Serratia fonticola]CAI0710003.1 Uncharacterised protein [Serratia fonticola]